MYIILHVDGDKSMLQAYVHAEYCTPFMVRLYLSYIYRSIRCML